MTIKEEKVYQTICHAVGRDGLTDADIQKIALFLQGHLGQPGNQADLSVGEPFHVNPDLG